MRSCRYQVLSESAFCPASRMALWLGKRRPRLHVHTAAISTVNYSQNQINPERFLRRYKEKKNITSFLGLGCLSVAITSAAVLSAQNDVQANHVIENFSAAPSWFNFGFNLSANADNSKVNHPNTNDNNIHKNTNPNGTLVHEERDDNSSAMLFRLDDVKFVGKPYSELVRRYSMGKVIGEGTFASVRIALDNDTGRHVAVKEVRKDLSDQTALENEVRVLLASGKHENIISLIDVYDSKDILYIVTDLADAGELFDKIIEQGEISEKSAAKMILEAVTAIKHLHDHDIIHLDIKPENLLLSSMNEKEEDSDLHIKLADFGLAIKLPGPEFHYVRTECVGTPAYWAPELIKNEAFGKAVDIWALGCVLYILLCGSHPFDPYGDAPESEILSRALKGDYDRDNAQYKVISPQGKDLISHMLDPDPDARYDAKQCLNHPWLSESEHILSEQPLPLTYISKLKAFRILRLLRMGISVHSSMSGDSSNDVEGCVKMFSSFDANNDGVLSRKELADALKRLGVSFNNKEMDDVFSILDSDEDGKITSDDFVRAVLEERKNFVQEGAEKKSVIRELSSRDRLMQIKLMFDTLDKNGDGYLEQEDCVHLMNQLGNLRNKNKLFEKIRSFQTKSKKYGKDRNNTKVDFAEFVKFYRAMEAENGGRVNRGMTINKKRVHTNVLRTATAKTKSGSKTQSLNSNFSSDVSSSQQNAVPVQAAA